MTNPPHPVPESAAPHTLNLATPVLAGLSVGVLLSVALAGYTAYGQNELARRQSEHLAASMLAEFRTNVAKSALDYSFWDDAVRNVVTKLDPVWADANFGKYLAENFEVSTFAVDEDDRPIYTWVGQKAGLEDPFTLYKGGIRRLVDKAREGERAAAPVPAVGLVTDGTDVLVAAASVFTDYMIVDGAEVNERTGAILLLTHRLTPDLLARTSKRYLLEELHVVGEPHHHSGPGLDLLAADGTKLGLLRWKAKRPGDATLGWIIPGLVLVFALMAICTLVFVRRARDVVSRLAADVAARRRAEQGLMKSREELESRVATRTEQLSLANAELETEIDAHRASESARRTSEERFRDFASTAADWFWETDVDHRLSFVSEAVQECVGIEPSELVGRRPDAALETVVLDRESLEQFMYRMERQEVLQNHRLDFRLIDGNVRVVQVSGRAIHSECGEFRGYRGSGSDLTESHRLSEELSYQATHDSLTGLVNRWEFDRRLERVLEMNVGSEAEHAVCYVDLDNFKAVNDTYGHSAGDELLRQIGIILPASLRQRDTMARLGGDEFAILMEHCPLKQAARVAEQLRDAVRDFRFHWQGRELRVGASIGVVPIATGLESASRLLSAADRACYHAKSKGRNQVHVEESAEVNEFVTPEEIEGVARIVDALESDGFELYVQRIQPAAEAATRLPAIEVLLRLALDSGEILLPGLFLPVVERHRLSGEIDQWVVEHVFRWLAQNPETLERFEYCSINLGAPSLESTSLLAFIEHQLDTMAIPPRKICFEITETTAISNLSMSVNFIDTLRKLGCRFALDDFGSGFSSFGYLQTLPVDIIKIDGVFVQRVALDPINRAIVTAINDVAKLSGCTTVAEYVSDGTILKVLRDIEVDFVQGHAIHEAEPLDALTRDYSV
jgi:diguanylate cyclase (GGDEF)-like protein/PAS domain S-box-containing protein